jgi:hypothetical protein
VNVDEDYLGENYLVKEREVKGDSNGGQILLKYTIYVYKK